MKRYKKPTTLEGKRIIALMELHGFSEITEFAHAIGVTQQQVSNVTALGMSLPKSVAFAIRRRFHVGTDFLWLGDPLAVYSTDLREKLREYETTRGVKLFANSR